MSLRNELTGELFVLPRGPAAVTGVRRGQPLLLSTEGGEAAARSTPVSGRKGAAGTLRVEAAWPDGVRLIQEVSVGSGDLVIRQEAAAKGPPAVGVQWGIAEVPAHVEVLVPGNSGLRFGPGAPDGDNSWEYPSSWEAQFIVLQGKRGGFLVAADDTKGRLKALWLRRREGRSQIGFETRAVAPFSRVTGLQSVAWRIRPYRGSWQVGARLYRQWAEKAFGLAAIRAARPKWAETIRCVAIVPMDLALLDELARRLDPRRTLLYVPNWRRDGYDRNYPDYTADPAFGPWNERAHALGFRVMPHVNYFGCDPLNPLYSQFQTYQMRDPFTNEPLWWTWDLATPPIKFAYINPGSLAWRQLFVARMRELCARYRVDALHLDQTLCIFNDNNGRVDGMTCLEGNLGLHRDLRAALPNVALSGEGLDEVTFRYEEFAQRHPYGLDFIQGTWSDRLMALAHPISSAIFTPHTTLYGYLGMCSPSAGGLYHAWRRAYGPLGVIPTLAHPTLQLVRESPDTFEPFFAEARFFQRTQARPDFEREWPAGTAFLHRLEGGGRARLVRDRGAVLVAETPGGRRQVIYRRIEGVERADLPGSIPGWRAYDERGLIGLDPEQSYGYVERPRDPAAFHVAALPPGVIVRRVGVRPEMVTVGLADARAEVARLWDFHGPAEAGTRLCNGMVRRYRGATFTDDTGAGAQPEAGGLFMHPPWRPVPGVRPGPEGLGISFAQFRVRLPDRPRIRFEAGTCLRPFAVGKSDGVTFRVEARAGGEVLRTEAHAATAEPVPLSLNLSSFRGQQVLLRLETHPGPRGDVSWDHAVFAKPRVVAEDPSPRRVVFAGARGVKAALGPDGMLPLLRHGADRCAVDAPLGSPLYLLLAEPETVSLPLSLREARRFASLVHSDGIEKPATGFTQPVPGEAAVGGVARPALHAHPPNNGLLVVDYILRLPATPARFEAFVGIRDTSVSTGVRFAVQVNGREAWSARVLPNEPWRRAEVDLGAHAGKPVVLSLVTDSLGGYDYDWAVWGEPRVEAR